MRTGARGDLVAWIRRPEAVPLRAVVVLVHGLGEHSGRYRETAAELARAGFATLGYDLQGHGRSPGPRGVIEDYDAVLDDIAAALDDAVGEVGPVPQVLLGHSMGGNFAANYVLRRPHKLAGMILSAPMLRAPDVPRHAPMRMARRIGRRFPRLCIPSPVGIKPMTHDWQRRRQRLADPWMHRKISLLLAAELVLQGRWALEHAAELSLPTLVIHGDQDTLTSPEASREFCKRAGAKATFARATGMFHEALQEVGRERIFALLRRWIATTVGPSIAD